MYVRTYNDSSEYFMPSKSHPRGNNTDQFSYNTTSNNANIHLAITLKLYIVTVILDEK